MNINDYVPFIAAGVLALAGIVVAIVFLMRKRKKQPLTQSAIPALPSQKEASSHFSPLPQTATIHPHAQMTSSSKNKKMVIGALAGLTILVVFAISYFVSRQPTSPIKQAAPPSDTNSYVHRENTIGEVSGDSLVAGGLFGYYDDNPPAPTPDSLNVTVRIDLFWCPEMTETNDPSCATQVGTDTQNAVLNWGDRQIRIVGGIVMDQRCGVYQVDSYYDPYNPSEPNPGKAGSAVYSWGRACTEPTGGPTITPGGASPTPTPTTAPNTYRISGRYINIGLSPTPANCQTATGTSANLNTYQTNLYPVNRVAFTQDYPAGQPGAFLYYNTPNNTYSMDGEVPTGLQYVCAYSPTSGSTYGFRPTIAVNGADVPGIKYVFREVASAATPIPTATPSPTPTTVPGAATSTPIPTKSPTPSPSPTTGVQSGNTPTPTEIILVKTSATPVSTSAAAPTIPSAGSPWFPLIIGIPLVFILLAFVL